MTDILPIGVAPTADAIKPQSPEWWLHRLIGQLFIDRPRMVLMDRYYRGDHPLPSVPRELTQEYKRMLVQSRSNFMGVVVDAPAERLSLQGFRVRGAEDADKDAWSWWLDQGMEVDANLAIVNALAMGRGYLSIWKFDGEDEPRVQVEDPRMCIVEMAPGNRQMRAAALRIWNDDYDGSVYADVWLPDACFHFKARADRVLRSQLWPQTWEPPFPVSGSEVRRVNQILREEQAKTVDEWAAAWQEIDQTKNPHGEVPIVPIVNKPSTLKIPDGESEIDDVYLTQERINEMLFNRSLAAWTAAYQQKWATGIDIPIDEDGNPVQTFQAAIDRLFADTSPDARFGAFPATDLNNYIQAVEEDVQHIAVQTRTPRHYFLQQGQSPSGDAIKSAEAGLVAKVVERQRHYGRAFAEVVRLRQMMNGKKQPDPIETIWADPEFRTLAELTDAVVKQVQTGIIPIPTAREKIGYSPSEIERMELFDAQAALVANAQAALEVDQAPADELPPGKPAPSGDMAGVSSDGATTEPAPKAA